MHTSSGGRSPRAALLAVVLVALAAPPAVALDNDPTLRRFFETDAAGNPVPDQAAFGRLARELGMVMAPRLLSPAESLGLSGFHFGLELSINNVNEGAEHWERGVEDENPPGTLLTTQLRVRKGLPYSFEVGGGVTWLADSELLALGGEVKWTVNEAVDSFPVDFAVRAALSRAVGSTELDLTIFGLDFVVSRGFGVGGVANIAPYMAYNPVFVYARSQVLDATPGTADDAGNAFVLTEESPVLHRFVLGTRFLFSVVSFTPEVVLTKGLQAYNFSLGLDY